MKKIILIGGGGHCISCIDVIESEKKFQINGVVLPILGKSKYLLDYPIIGTDEDLPKLLKKTPNVIICVGQIKNPKIRIKLFNFLKKNGANFPIIKSPYSYCSKYSTLGAGTILMHNSIVNANSNIGLNCIINSRSLVEHDVKIDNYCHISTGAIINGGVKVGQGSFVGSGSIVKEGVTIGKQVIIGSGKTILKDVLDGTIIK